MLQQTVYTDTKDVNGREEKASATVCFSLMFASLSIIVTTLWLLLSIF